jgi:hypothetical protein
MACEFIQDQGKVTEGPAKSVELEHNEAFNLAFANVFHEFVQANARRFRARSKVRVGANVLPSSALAIVFQLSFLAVQLLPLVETLRSSAVCVKD